MVCMKQEQLLQKIMANIRMQQNSVDAESFMCYNKEKQRKGDAYGR